MLARLPPNAPPVDFLHLKLEDDGLWTEPIPIGDDGALWAVSVRRDPSRWRAPQGLQRALADKLFETAARTL
jgi:hypothetical protein